MVEEAAVDELGLPASSYPALFLAADAASRTGQESFVMLSRLELVLLIAAAGFGTAISFAGDVGNRLVAAFVAILLSSAVIVRSVTRSTESSKRWFEGRAVAESVKTLAWKYMAHAVPLNVSDGRADGLFIDLLAEVMGEHFILTVPRELSTGGPPEQITPQMCRVRGMPFLARRAFYLEHRMRDQLAWYSKRSRDHKRTSDLWFVVGIVSELAAVIYAVLLVVTPSWPNMIGLLSTITAASATLARLRGDNEMSQRYALAAQELALIQHRIETSNEHSFSDHVIEAEAAISREHKMWAAKHG